ncbi:hypothetical protein [Nocardioides sp. SYSU D00065]|uniref:hypothetical protein n=1 Tax=Nocardioides sp. SYSU D00065 TaxID=2817378 RepID=UPI001B32F0A4|nr:hypothetical protein [Nocardioides sp. SYSU D00065]
MRIALVLLVLAVGVYVVVRLLQRRAAARRGGSPAPPPVRPHSPRAEQDYRRAVRERAERQRRGVPEPEPEPEPTPATDAASRRVVIDDDVFGPDEWGDPGSEYFVVTSAASARAVADAVARAGRRFMLVDELGREHADDDAAVAAFTEGLYTPNYTADPVVTPHGVEGYVDCKGVIPAPMGVTFTRILREELERLGAPAHVRTRGSD